MKKTVTASQLASELKISTRRIGQLVKAGVLPRGSRNQYALVDCKERYRKYKITAGPGDDSQYLRFLRLQNDLIETKNKIKRGELIHKDDFMNAIGNNVQNFRARLLAIPAKAAPLLVASDDRKALKILNRFIDEALRELGRPIDFRKIALWRLKEMKKGH